MFNTTIVVSTQQAHSVKQLSFDVDSTWAQRSLYCAVSLNYLLLFDIWATLEQPLLVLLSSLSGGGRVARWSWANFSAVRC